MLRPARPAFAFAALALAACGAAENDPGAAAAAMGGFGAPPVPVAQPLVERVADWDAYSGRFAAPQAVQVRARVGGYLEEVHFQDGQLVEQGELLFTIDARPYEATAAAARSQAARSEAQRDQARRDLDRTRSLAAGQAVSQQELENAQSALDQAEAAHQAAIAALRSAQLDLDFTRISAPISGRASDRRVDPGNLVRAGEDVLTTLVAADPIHFEFEASESALLAYQRQNRALEGASVQVRLQGDPDYGRVGVLTFADNIVDAATGTVRLRAELPNPDGFLRPGMYGEARMQGSAPYEAVLVPQTAVLSDATRRLVYVVTPENVVQPRPVTLGPLSGDLQVIASGLEPGERIVVSGLLGVQPGMTVDPQPQPIARGVSGAAGAGALPAQ